ncbi:MAG TPA: integration host factor subunit beta [Bacteroidetes bacterium]|nr:integration host factor subunit beta [Bacteroidota bacterium]
MNKADLVDIISEGTGLTKVETAAVIDAFLATVAYALSKGERVELRRFGTFSLKDRKPKVGRNPKTGVTVPIPARKVPHFKPSPELKKFIEEQLKAEKNA